VEGRPTTAGQGFDPTFAAALDALPKVELHCHVEGTMRPATVIDLAHRNAVHLPTSTWASRRPCELGSPPRRPSWRRAADRAQAVMSGCTIQTFGSQ
jgi:hypothetical protein